MSYNPGLHLLINLRNCSHIKLEQIGLWKDYIKVQISDFELEEVGSALHAFPSGGYTAIHALTESHVSVHTWPEYAICTCDIFLSNFRKNNHEKVRILGKNITGFFESSDFDWKEIER